jgi:hypothetical protein
LIASLSRSSMSSKREPKTSRSTTRSARVPVCKPRRPRTCSRRRKLPDSSFNKRN